jgi:DNA-binding Xre family transcriptional regulator
MNINIQKIKKEMAKNGWNYTRLAKEMGISKQRLHFIFSPKYKSHTLRTIERFAQVLELEPKDLLI